MKTRILSAFTLIEMLVVISIIAILAAFAVPALTNALTKGQMTGTMNNARQLYLAGYQMALDGTTNSDSTLGWPGDLIPAGTVTTLQAYCTLLVNGGYLQASDLPKLLSAPSATLTATSTGTAPTIAVTLGGTSGLKVYPVTANDPGNCIYAASANYVYDTALLATAVPFANKGFVVIRKGGDASVLRQSNAVAATGSAAISAFESTVGKKSISIDPIGTVSAGDPTGFFHFP